MGNVVSKASTHMAIHTHTHTKCFSLFPPLSHSLWFFWLNNSPFVFSSDNGEKKTTTTHPLWWSCRLKWFFRFWFAVSTVNGVIISIADKPHFGREIWIFISHWISAGYQLTTPLVFKSETFGAYFIFCLWKKQINKIKQIWRTFLGGTQPWFGCIPVFSWASLLLIWLHRHTHLLFWITIKSFCSLLIHLRNLCYSPPPPHILFLLILNCLGLEYLLSRWFSCFLSFSFLPHLYL